MFDQLLTELANSLHAHMQKAALIIALCGAGRIVYLLYMGRDKKMIFEESMTWVIATILLSSVIPIYEWIIAKFR